MIESEIDKIEKMSIEEFDKFVRRHDDNILKTWSFNSFKVICQKCNSDDIRIVANVRHYYDGCPSCGYHEFEGGILVKCINCGNAIRIFDANDYDD